MLVRPARAPTTAAGTRNSPLLTATGWPLATAATESLVPVPGPWIMPPLASWLLLKEEAAIASILGPMGIGAVYGLASNDNVHLYAVAGTSVYTVNTVTGVASALVNYGGQGLGAANGTAFLTEAIPLVPEPANYVLLAAGFGLLGIRVRLNKKMVIGEVFG